MCMDGYSGDATKGTPYDCVPSKITVNCKGNNNYVFK